MELKYNKLTIHSLPLTSGSNRTFMELKFYNDGRKAKQTSSNRTFMELKFLIAFICASPL